ncbi:DUF1617 family protein [Jeotgalibacillus haloalkalitolerans]|uniref:DUF1617 family protein n=1 Tax=Jeotgalibacillus haloalkalitolerans TaxID=3104292 RepID=A0ABU5KLX3_9BACL|nr:DUF1617 family protein [Jeotgalibacillus sp. HH7-29]MDZ5712234.1 DUF1617 family protein [Jeotgalibacillus sp. HH7-29]
MKLEIENGKIFGSINLLSKLVLKNKESRHRSDLIEELEKQLKKVAKHEKTLLEEHSRKNDEGEALKKEDGSYDVLDMESLTQEKQELFEEVFILEGGNVTGYLKTVKKVLFECEEEWSGPEASIYNYLCKQFEKETETKSA